MIVTMSKTSKEFLSEDKVQAQYDSEAAFFQKKYNAAHPGRHIWKHGYNVRTVRFLSRSDKNETVVKIKVLRFIVEGTYKTFTFYGSLLLSHTQYAFSYLKEWISRKPPILSSAIIQRWKSVVRAGENPARVSRLNC